jgi:hypothetical protein
MSNRNAFREEVEWREPPAPPLEALLFDPQTSGGLLLFVPGGRESELLAELEEAWVVGRAVERGARPIIIV